MRESGAKRAAIGMGVLVVVGAAVFAVTMQQDRAAPSADAPTTAAADDAAIAESSPVEDQTAADSAVLALGEAVFDEQGCASCHSIDGVGSPRSPLDGVGARLGAEDIRLWIVDPQAMRPGIRKPAFSDLPPEQEDALVAFIQSLR